MSKILKDYGLDWSSDFDYFAVHILNNFLVDKDGGTGWTGIGATDRSKLWNSVLALYKHENVHLARVVKWIAKNCELRLRKNRNFTINTI